MLAFSGVVALSAGLNFWNLSANGWANAFYTAAVQSGLHSGEAFLFGSSDWGNSISVDKPPLSLWLMGLSVRIFGFNSWGILLPQALLGLATTGLIYYVVRRRTSTPAALAASAVFATTPIVVLLSRYNNPDPLLIFLMVFALEATLRGMETQRKRWFLAAGVLLGLGFMAKQLQVLLVVPGLVLATVTDFNTSWRGRFLAIGAAAVSFGAVAGAWLAVVDLTPAAQRPYVGGSASNSLTELTLGYNGLTRLTSSENTITDLIPSQFTSGADDRGLLRLFSVNFDQEASWLLLLGLACGIVAVFGLPRGRVTPLARASILWLATAYGLLSFMGHDIHTYYTANLAPPLALTTGLGIETVLRAPRSVWRRVVTSVGIGLSALASWLTLGSLAEGSPGRGLASTVLALALTGGLLTAIPPPRAWINVVAVVTTTAGLTIGPLATDSATVSRSQTGSSPVSGSLTANPNSMSRFLASLTNHDPKWAAELAFGASPPALLTEQFKNTSESCRWAAATFPAQTAANWQLSINRPIMPLGGFSATDPNPTLEQFKKLVAQGSICYMIDYPEMDPVVTTQPTISAIVSWVRSAFPHETIDGVTIYQLSD